MTRVLPILLLASLSGCFARSTPPAAWPTIPPLPPSISQACPPPAPVADASIAALVRADVALALDYRGCRARHQAAVDAYEAARAVLARGRTSSPSSAADD